MPRWGMTLAVLAALGSLLAGCGAGERISALRTEEASPPRRSFPLTVIPKIQSPTGTEADEREEAGEAEPFTFTVSGDAGTEYLIRFDMPNPAPGWVVYRDEHSGRWVYRCTGKRRGKGDGMEEEAGNSCPPAPLVLRPPFTVEVDVGRAGERKVTVTVSRP